MEIRWKEVRENRRTIYDVMKEKNLIFFFVLFLFSPLEKPFSVEISPGPQIAAQIGDSVMLTCESMGCESPSFSWRTQMDSPLVGSVKNERTKSTLTLNPVSFEHEHSYLCTVTCGSKKMEKGIQVNLYCKCFSELSTLIPLVWGKICNPCCWCTMRSVCLERRFNIVESS